MSIRPLVFVLAFSWLAITGAYAHGEHKPKHGGLVGRGDEDVVVEFVVAKRRVVVYIDDEQGEPVETKDVQGTLTMVVPQQPDRSVKLVPEGVNKLAAEGIEAIGGGRLIARLTFPEGREFRAVVLVPK